MRYRAAMTESNLVQHARRELDLLTEEDPEIKASILRAVEGFASYEGHSGGSAMVCIGMLERLLNFRSLSALTDSPAEWMDVSEQSGYEMWQSRRNSEAFSHDGGKTFWLLSEGAHAGNRKPLHDSVPALGHH
jgi:hypothetical protein